MQSSNTIKAILLACLGSMLIGTSAVFVRLSDLGPIMTGFYRMLFALPFFAVWLGREKREGVFPTLFPTKGIIGLVLAGAFFAFDLALWNWSINYTTIVNSTLFNNTAAFFVPLIMWVVFQEKQSIRFMIAATTGFIGCLFLAGESISIGSKNILGDIVALASGLMFALYLVSIQRIREEISTGFLMFWVGGLSVLFLAFFSYVFGESFWPLTFQDIISVFGQAVLVHVIGQGLMAYSLGKIPAAYAAVILFLAPVTGAILGWIIYAEALGVVKIFGMALIMLSIVSVKKGF